jgi:N-acylneuraminate cytidylyltransferase
VIKRDLLGLSRLVFLQCTSPFTTGADIDRGLTLMQDQAADCALSVVPDHGFLWGLDSVGYGTGLNHDPTQQRQRRQDLPPQYRESGAFYCVDLKAFRATGQRFCGKVALCEVDHPGGEIDSLADLALCNMLAVERAEIAVPQLRKIRAVVTDFDGVHTDNLVRTDETGTESVLCSRSDGMGLGLLRDDGRWAMMILSKDRNACVMRRAEKLRLDVRGGVDDKVAVLTQWLAAQGINWAEVLYVGNDVNDADAMQQAGVSACPSDAHPSILCLSDWILPARGGQGALRHLCDRLLELPA